MLEERGDAHGWELGLDKRGAGWVERWMCVCVCVWRGGRGDQWEEGMNGRGPDGGMKGEG